MFDLCNFIVKWNLEKQIIGKPSFFLFFIDFKLLMFHNNIMKHSEILNDGNLLKTCLSLPNLAISAYFAAIFTT